MFGIAVSNPRSSLKDCRKPGVYAGGLALATPGRDCAMAKFLKNC